MKKYETKNLKNMILGRIVTVVVGGMTAMLCTGTVPVMAGGTEAECICETTCSENEINPDCPVCAADYHYCECKPKDDPEDVVREEGETPDDKTETYDPLTPDGNMTLVDDYGSPGSAGKQFITVVTKAGNYFYIIIDRDDKGNETVHFLNMVDEADLLALMEEKDVETYMASRGISVKEEEPVIEEKEDPEPTRIPEEEEPEPEPETKKGNGRVLLLCFLLGVGSIAAYIYMKRGNGGKRKAEIIDPDLDYDEEIENRLSIPIDEIDDIEDENGVDEEAMPWEEQND